jgi:hypothetical protein
MENIQLFIDYWDKLIAKWLNDDERTLLVNKDCFFKADERVPTNSPVKLCRDKSEIPEPYWGNLGKCSAVVINLNPGMGETNRNEFYENFAKSLCKKRFSEIAIDFPWLEEGLPGSKFWQQKHRWIVRLCNILGKEISEERMPFALELCPYHSKKWNGNLLKNEEVKIHIERNVFAILETAIKNSLLPFALAVGKDCYNALIDCGFESVKNVKICDCNNPIWPKRLSDNRHKSRGFALLEKGNVRILCTWCSRGGSNTAPADDFEEVEKDILKRLDEQY